jgi:hypothetical protein
MSPRRATPDKLIEYVLREAPWMTPETVIEFLSCEGMRPEEEPKHLYREVRAFRKLTQVSRLRRVRGIHEVLAKLREANST